MVGLQYFICIYFIFDISSLYLQPFFFIFTCALTSCPGNWHQESPKSMGLARDTFTHTYSFSTFFVLRSWNVSSTGLFLVLLLKSHLWSLDYFPYRKCFCLSYSCCFYVFYCTHYYGATFQFALTLQIAIQLTYTPSCAACMYTLSIVFVCKISGGASFMHWLGRH